MGRELNSVLSLSSGVACLQCLCKVKGYVLPIELTPYDGAIARLKLAEYELEKIKKKGKLRDGIKEEELQHRLKEIEMAQLALFKV
jgi:hypothetical protein